MMQVLVESKLVSDLGWTLLHSIWQIGVVAIGLLTLLRILRNYEANVRYLVAIAALSISVALPVITFVQISGRPDATAPSVNSTTDPNQSAEAEAIAIRESGTAGVRQPRSTAETDDSSASLSAIFASLERTIPVLLPFAVAAWLVGVAFFSLRMAGGFVQLREFRTRTVTSPNECWSDKFDLLCEATFVGRSVKLLCSELVETPIAIGILRPVILIPAGLFLQISPRELETIIAHELIHIRRYDPLVNLMQCVIETLFFYHPGAWWISAQIRREREFAADEAVMMMFDDSHITYARALANLEEIRLRTNQQMPRYATAANGGNFMHRIQRILKIKTEVSSANSAWTAGLALLITSAFLLAIFSFSTSEVVNAQKRSGNRQLAIGFVSIPPVDRTANAPKDSDATARMLIQELKEHKVPAIGFLQGGMISDGDKLYPVRANIARLWIDAGFEIGIGGYKHIALHNTPADEYIANIEKNERVLNQLIGNSEVRPRYFSYPFLNAGKTIEDKARVESWLASHGYTSVKYTFDNQEWMYSWAYDMARNDNDINTMKEIREAYLAYMEKMFEHYEAYSQQMFGRDIPQTMVLTPSRLITDTSDEFFAMVAKRGYTFVSMEEAQRDAAYKTKEDFVGTAGISWFERWTMAKGERLRNEPAIDPEVEKAWNDRQAKLKK